MAVFNVRPAQAVVPDDDILDPFRQLLLGLHLLVTHAADTDPTYLVDLLCRLRPTARIAALVGAVEAGRVFTQIGEVHLPGRRYRITARQLVDAVCTRADDPGEVFAYWLTHYGRAMPRWLKRGVGDAILRLYTPAALVQDDPDAWLRFADVIALSNIPRTYGDRTGLYRRLLDQRPRARRRADEAGHDRPGRHP